MDEIIGLATADVDFFVVGVAVAGFAVSPSSLVAIFSAGIVAIIVVPSSLVAIWAAGIVAGIVTGIVAGIVAGLVVLLRELVLVPTWWRPLVNASDPVLGCFSTRLIVLGGEVVEGPVSLLSSCDLKSSWFSACWT